MSQAKRWCFTLNNPTADEIAALSAWASTNPAYCIIGREVGENGTPHLQGFLILKRKRRLAQCKLLPGLSRAHFEVTRGTAIQAAEYCKKDGDFHEFGSLPESQQGKRSDFEIFKDWCKARDSPPTEYEIADEFPSLFGRYASACRRFADLFCSKPNLVDPGAQLRDWQQELLQVLSQPADDRKIIFIVDAEGNKGKSWFIRYMLTVRPGSVQRLSCGKRDDLAFAVDETKSIFLFDIPRGQLEFMQYSVLEQLKDGIIFSPKYESRSKRLNHTAHVVVFTNEQADMNKLSMDRYVIVNLY